MRLQVPERGWTFVAVLGVALAVGALGVWAQNGALVGVNYDDGVYALLGRSIAWGDGYRLSYLPVPIPGVKYPPIYPLSLAPFWILGGSPDSALAAMKIASGLYLGLAAGLFVLLLVRRRILTAPAAALVALISFASGFMMLISNGLLSEPLYLVLLFAALSLCDSEEAPPRTARFVAIGLLAGAAALTRTVGVALVGASILAVGLRSGWRRGLVVLVSSALLLVPWTLFSATRSGQIPPALVPRYGSYLHFYLANVADSPGAAVSIALTNVGAIFQTAGVNLVPGLPVELYWVAGGLVLALAALGSRTVFERAPTLVLYHWLYLALISLWAFPPFRFLFALVPVTLALGAAAVQRQLVGSSSLRHLLRAEPRVEGSSRLERFVRPLTAALAALFVLNLAYHDVRALASRVWDPAQFDRSVVSAEVVSWVKRNTSSEDVIAYEFEPLIALHTGRRAVPNNYSAVHVWYREGSPSPELLGRLLAEMGVDYLAVRRDVPAVASQINALMGRFPGGLDLLRITPHGALIFKANPAALSLESDGAAGAGSMFALTRDLVGATNFPRGIGERRE